jgi:hypothetical protein
MAKHEHPVGPAGDQSRRVKSCLRVLQHHRREAQSARLVLQGWHRPGLKGCPGKRFFLSFGGTPLSFNVPSRPSPQKSSNNLKWCLRRSVDVAKASPNRKFAFRLDHRA